MNQALDAAGRIPAAEAARLGFKGVLGYLERIPRSYVDACLAAGLWFSPIAEFDTLTWHPLLHAPELGDEHAQRALNALRGLGAPTGLVVWFTADTFIAEHVFHLAGRYLDLAGSVMHPAGYKVGIYGGAALVKWALENGHADYGWVSGAASWDSPEVGRGRTDPATAGAVMHQRGGGTVGGCSVDYNDLYIEGWPAWGVPQPSHVETVPSSRGRQMLEIVRFDDHDDLWVHGYDHDGEFFRHLDGNEPNLSWLLSLPVRYLAHGDDALDAAFHLATGL